MFIPVLLTPVISCSPMSVTQAITHCHGFSVTAGVVDNGDKFLAIYIDTGEQFSPVTTTPAINLLPVTTTLVNRVFVESMDASFFMEVRNETIGSGVRGWIATLHREASATFLLHDISPVLSIFFSIRQGDPLASLLIISYLEPFLA